MSERTAPWGDHELPVPGQVDHMDFGPLRIWLRRVENELWVAALRSEDGAAPPRDPPHDVDWSRWALAEEAHRLRIVPALPDRLLVVGMEHPFTLMRRAEARIYMRVGAWVRLEVVAGDREVARLVELPTEQLSETWWGNFLEGELGYWVTTRARRQLSDDLFEPHLIMCVIQLANRSVDDLPVQKLALRVEHLSVFADGERLWAEETVVEYQGEDEGSDISMDDEPPREAGEPRELTPARLQSKGFRARTFDRLRALSPFSAGG